MMEKVTAVVLSAGSGKRMNTATPKQYLLLEEKPILFYCLMAFQKSNVDDIVIVCKEEDISFVRDQIVRKYGFTKVSGITTGGKERYDSVYNGLNVCSNTDYVLIHDGARPFITPVFINQMIARTIETKACVAGVPTKDTIKYCNERDCIKDSPDRRYLWMAQTPQGFSYATIKKAYELLLSSHEKDVTDDAMVLDQMLSIPSCMMMCSYRNIKITTPEDLIIAQAYMSNPE